MDRLFEQVYDHLHAVARGMMRRERRDHTLQATAVVDEAYTRLPGNARVEWAPALVFP